MPILLKYTLLGRTLLLGLVWTLNTANAQSLSSTAVADSLYATGNYTKAINFYAKDASVTSALQIARAYNAIGNYEKAIAQYKNIISKDSSLQIARYELGKLFLKTNKYPSAADLFFDLIQDGSRNPENYYHMGRALTELGSIDEGLLNFKSAYELDSAHLRSIFELGKYYVSKREKDSVLKYVDKGLAFYANDLALINLKALALYNNEQYAEALSLFERLVELGEKKEFIYSKLAYCYFRTWDFENAKVTYNKVLKINDGNADAYYNLGQIFLKDRQIDSAEYHFKESIAVQKPFLAREYESLARIARIKENVKLALEYYKLAYQEDSDNAMIYFNVCTVADQYYKDVKTRLDYYEKFIEKFGRQGRYMSQMAEKRISELKEEIHFDSN